MDSSQDKVSNRNDRDKTQEQNEKESDKDIEKEGKEEDRDPLLDVSIQNPRAGCRSVDNYEKLNKISEGTYGVVYRAKEKTTGRIYALKKIKMEKEKEGFPITSLREVKILLGLQHVNIVSVKEVVVGSSLDSIYMVMEYIEHDLRDLIESMDGPFLSSEVKCLMRQLLSAVAYMHESWIIHRDLKTSNLLYSNNGYLKVADFGLARQYASPLKPYTHNVVTLWYRAPELLLGQKLYTTAVDMWSVGCIFAEFLGKEALLPGKSELDQLDKMFKLLGTPTESIWPGLSELPNAKRISFINQPYNNLRQRFPYATKDSLDLLNKLLTYDPSKRLTAADALLHPYFTEPPKPQNPEMMPTFPPLHERKLKKRKADEESSGILMARHNNEESYFDMRDKQYIGSKAFRLRM